VWLKVVAEGAGVGEAVGVAVGVGVGDAVGVIAGVGVGVGDALGEGLPALEGVGFCGVSSPPPQAVSVRHSSALAVRDLRA
jgi:hypothetical protein